MKIRRNVLLALLAVIAACASDDTAPSSSAPGNTSEIPGLVTKRFEVKAAEGGEFELGGGTKLVIPKDALSADTTITAHFPESQGPTTSLMKFAFEPEGLVFKTPATLRIPYADINGVEPGIMGYQSSQMNPLTWMSKSELSDALPLTIQNRDTEANLLDLRVDHFSFFRVLIQVDSYFYLGVDIPYRYLLPGDLLFVLTKADDEIGPHWNPGHVGVLTGGGEACKASTASDEIVESTTVSSEEIESAKARREVALAKGLPEPVIPMNGVRTSALRNFKTDSGHFYLGPRRPKMELSAADRASVVSFVRAQVGKPYNIIGGGNLAEGSYSCVGLAEAAYDSIGKGSIEPSMEALGTVPLELFRNTTDVEEITVGVGEVVDIPVRSAIVHPESPFLSWFRTVTTGGWYCDAAYPCGPSGAQADVTLKLTGNPPPGHTFSQGKITSTFSYTALPEHAGQSFDFAFYGEATVVAADGNGGGVPQGTFPATRKLKINVVPCAGVTTPACFLPTDPPEDQNACLMMGDDAKAAADAAGLVLATGGEFGNSNPEIIKQLVLAQVDLASVAAWVGAMSEDEFKAAFGNTYFPCGAGTYGTTLCPNVAATGSAGDWVIVQTTLAADVPLTDSKYSYQYGFVFDSDNTTSNNYQPSAKYADDYFQGTDRWYAAEYTPSGGWKLKVSDAKNGAVKEVASAARLVIQKNTMTLAIPSTEFSVQKPGFRVTAFRHAGDYGQNPPYDYSADAHPAVRTPLLAVQ